MAEKNKGLTCGESLMLAKEFWKATAERAIRAAANALVGLIAVGMAWGDWVKAGEVALVAAITSVLLSLAASSFGPKGPSFGAETLVAPAPGTPPVTDPSPFPNSQEPQ